MNLPLLDPDEYPAPIAVITGGWSSERERSLVSGHAVLESLDRQNVKAKAIDLDVRAALAEGLSEVHIAFLAIAGRGAEDGRLQGALETLGIDYTGSGVLSSALAMNKPVAKAIVQAAGVRVPAGSVVDPTRGAQFEADRLAWLLGFPVIVKPTNEGGSIGLTVARDVTRLAMTINVATPSRDLMVEEFCPGRSVSVGVLEYPDGSLRVFPPLEVDTSGEIYSYETKRRSGGVTYHCPARLTLPLVQSLARQAALAHRALHCHSVSRHDFVVTEDSGVFWLEANTLPGLSPDGNLARMAAAAGVTYDQLVAHIARGAHTDRRARP
ncbi:D-alanine--D-alanine ligase [Streptomyces sp. NPDC091292]|uniref:D-alanine--D-alanine ligase family protein n=1 Tax=Streptomyces sp. NPDC091292 TaxID=3365991 RepID=UPI00381E621C